MRTCVGRSVWAVLILLAAATGTRAVIIGPPQPPDAVDDEAVTQQDTAVVVDVLANDTHPTGMPLTVSAVTQPAGGAAVNNGDSVTYTPAPDFAGQDQFTYTVVDLAGLTDTATVTVTVEQVAPTNEPPTVAVVGGPFIVDEGLDVALTAAGADPEGLPLTYAWDLDGDGVFETPGQTVAFHGVDGPAVHAVVVRVEDEGGLSAEAGATVTVRNVAPLVGPVTGPTEPLEVGVPIDVSAPFTDPGVLDWHVAEWDWGDGATSVGLVDEFAGSGAVSGGHVYAAPGLYRVRVTVTDKDGDSGEALYEQTIVVYEPGVGHVTGGGWFQTPPGAYAPQPDLVGKSTFGFIAKYHKGDDAPRGETEFQCHQEMNFHSTGYDWLLVDGPRAFYAGSGRINGEGDYAFMVSIIDGKLAGGPDRMRMRVWRKDTGAVVYDNQTGDPDFADPVTPLNTGSIIIHKK